MSPFFATLQALAGGERQGRWTAERPTAAARLLAALCLVFLVGAVWSMLQSRAAALHEARIVAGNLASSVAQSIAGRLDTVDIILAGLQERVEADGFEGESGLRLSRVAARRATAGFAVNLFAVTDASGRVVASSAPDWTRQMSLRDDPGFQYFSARDARGRRLGEPFRSALDGRWVIGLMRRWNRPDGSFGGVTLGTVDLSMIQASFSGLDVGRDGVVSLWTSDGVRLAHFPPAPDGIGQRVPTAAAALSSGDSGVIERVSQTDRIARLFCYRHVDGYHLVQVVGLSKPEALAGWRLEARKTLLMALICALAIWLVGLRSVRDARRRAIERAAYRLLAEHATDMIFCLDTQLVRRYVSPASLEILGYEPDRLIGVTPMELLHPEDAAPVRTLLEALLVGGDRRSITVRARHRDGHWLWMDVHLRRFVAPESGRLVGIIGASRDASARKAAEAALQAANCHLATLANSDELTGLANRRHFATVIGREVCRSCRDATPLAVLMIDIDGFKSFNDRYGHPAGDDCLRAVAEAVAETLPRPGDLAARYGGEELVVLLPGTSLSSARRVADRVAAGVRQRAIPHADGIGGVVTVSIGVAAWVPCADADADTLIAAADRALYAAKAAGRARVEAEDAVPASA